MLVWCFCKIFKLFYDLISKLGKLAFGESSMNSLPALLVEVLYKDALNPKLIQIDRVLKVFDLVAESFFNRQLLQATPIVSH